MYLVINVVATIGKCSTVSAYFCVKYKGGYIVVS